MTRGHVAKIGDTKVAVNGYHYTRTADKWKLTHHIVAEAKLGRLLKTNERVTFKDKDRTNFNDPDNLVVVVKGSTTVARERARLQARIAELRAQLSALDE